MKVWCIQHGEEWCATAPQARFKNGDHEVKTRCGDWVRITPTGHCKLREPTCPKCKEAMAKK